MIRWRPESREQRQLRESERGEQRRLRDESFWIICLRMTEVVTICYSLVIKCAISWPLRLSSLYGGQAIFRVKLRQ